MADVVTFDPVNLRIVEINSGLSENELDVLEIYSEWKDWLLADPSRLGHPQAFSVVGGDPTIGSQSLGSTFFLENGWRIRPAEYTHKLTLSGNIFPRGGGSVFVPTLAALNVHTETLVSNIVDAITTAGTSPADVADAVWDEALAGHVVVGTAGAALGAVPSAAAVADAVLDEALAGHTTAGTAGKGIADAAALSPPSASAIADAVWDEATSGHASAGSTGAALTAAGAASPPSAATIAVAVWAALRASSQDAGSMGEAMVELFELMGLDPTKPLVVTPTSRDAGAAISQTVATVGTTTTVTRDP